MCTTFENWSKLAPIATLLIAFGALCVATFQFRLNRISQKENIAVQNFRDFLKLCIEKPDLADRSFDFSKGENHTRYHWFIGYMLWSIERVLEVYPNDKIWIENIKSIIQTHINYFLSEDFKDEEQFYNPSVVNLINSVRSAQT